MLVLRVCFQHRPIDLDQQFREAIRPSPHATTGDAPPAPGALVGLYSVFTAKKLTPEQMMGEPTVTCAALTAAGVDSFVGNKTRQGAVLSAAAAQDMGTCGACNVRGVVEDKARGASGRNPDDRGRNSDRRDDRERN